MCWVTSARKSNGPKTWKLREGRFELFVDGLKTAESPALSGNPLDVTHAQPLRLGAGETDSFSGRIQEVRMYRRALSGETIHRLAEPR